MLTEERLYSAKISLQKSVNRNLNNKQNSKSLVLTCQGKGGDREREESGKCREGVTCLVLVVLCKESSRSVSSSDKVSTTCIQVYLSSQITLP